MQCCHVAQASTNTKQQKLIIHLKRAEENHQCFLLAKNFFKPQSHSGLTKLLVPVADQPDTWLTVTNSQEIDYHLLEHSQSHFGKAHGTPYTVSPLAKLLGYNGLTNFGKQVLHGTAPLNDLPINHHTKLLLTHQQYCMPLHQPIYQEMPYDQLMQGFCKWKEHTSTSLSG